MNSHLNSRRRTQAPMSPSSTILVRIELDPAEINALVKRGHLLLKD